MRTREEVEAKVKLYTEAYDKKPTPRNGGIYDVLHWVLGEELDLEPDE